VEHAVVDRTGLLGTFNFRLDFALEEAMPSTLEPDPVSAAITAEGPSMFNALQDQLGLRLQSTKGPSETLIIDHVERPSEN
jgi:uncharacterized protein (TIGR03435 family)